MEVNSISMHIWSSKNISSCHMAVAVYFSYMTNSQKIELFPPSLQAPLTSYLPLTFWDKVFAGCVFAAFACVAQRPHTVSAGEVPWKGK